MDELKEWYLYFHNTANNSGKNLPLVLIMAFISSIIWDKFPQSTKSATTKLGILLHKLLNDKILFLTWLY